ncbi:MAG TPA: porin family protein [Allosphingosinicella sp.]|jgi:outer membrane immunogenic protein
MKKVISVLAAGVAFAALATPAAAAPTAGGRVEAIVGWDHNRLDLDDFGFADEDLSSDGIVFGVGAGYDFAVSPTASLGVDLEATESTADFDFVDGTDSAEISVGRDLYAGVRATFSVSPAANLYVKAGYTNARIRASADIDGDISSDSANADGLRGGAGVQFALGTSAYLSAEYRYSNYESGYSRHQVVGGIGFRF